MIGAFHRNIDAQNSNNEQYVRAAYFCGSGFGRDQTDGMPNNNIADGTDDGTGIVSDPVQINRTCIHGSCAGQSEIVSGDFEFILSFRSDENAGNVVTDNNDNNPATNAQNELGFSLDYQILSSCPDLTIVNSTTG